MVGAMSTTWWNCCAHRAVVRDVAGPGDHHRVARAAEIGASSLVPLNGVPPAQAQPAWYMLSVRGEPSTARPPMRSSAAICCSTVLAMLFCASSSLIEPCWPSALEPLSPKM